MKILIIFIIITFTGVVVTEEVKSFDNVVKLKSGQIRGTYLLSRNARKIYAYQGIPYGKPPIGDLRFKRIQPPDPWEGIVNTTAPGPMCVQWEDSSKSVIGQEDCLYLNVYTPIAANETVAKPYDVMVYIHGGLLTTGSGNINVFGPQYLLDRNIVLVTINYRLGSLGFLSTGDAFCSGNNGLKDQVASLGWVHDNIAAFGGNPNSVTIFGQCAGGASVHYHLLSPMSKGLFHRGISMSGTALAPWAHAPNGSTRYQAEKLGAHFHCPTKDSKALMCCLRERNPNELIEAENTIFREWYIHPIMPFKPVTESEVEKGDEAFLTVEPLEFLLTADGYKPVPWMVGFLKGDGAFLTSGIYSNKLIDDLNKNFNEILPMMLFFREMAPGCEDQVSDKIKKFYFGDGAVNSIDIHPITDMVTDAYFLAGIDSAVRLHTLRSGKVFYYEFEHRGANSWSTKFGESTRDLGVSHHDDLMYLFPQDHLFPNPKRNTEDNDMVDTLVNLWTNFARIENPTANRSCIGKWQPVSSYHKREFAKIYHKGVNMNENPHKKRTDFWSLLPHRARIPFVNKEII